MNITQEMVEVTSGVGKAKATQEGHRKCPPPNLDFKRRI